MSRRPGPCLAIDFSEDEKEVIGIMQARGGFTSGANVMRSALWSLADELGIELPNGVFDQRSHYDGTANLVKYNTSRRKVPAVTNPAPKPPRRRRPSRNHPWRAYPDPPPKPITRAVIGAVEETGLSMEQILQTKPEDLKEF